MCFQLSIKYLGTAIVKRVENRGLIIIMQGTVHPESGTSNWLTLTNNDRCVDKALTVKTIEKARSMQRKPIKQRLMTRVVVRGYI